MGSRRWLSTLSCTGALNSAGVSSRALNHSRDSASVPSKSHSRIAARKLLPLLQMGSLGLFPLDVLSTVVAFRPLPTGIPGSQRELLSCLTSHLIHSKPSLYERWKTLLFSSGRPGTLHYSEPGFPANHPLPSLLALGLPWIVCLLDQRSFPCKCWPRFLLCPSAPLPPGRRCLLHAIRAECPSTPRASWELDHLHSITAEEPDWPPLSLAPTLALCGY